MNKTEAAQFLGISVRSLERYVSGGKVSAHYERGKTGQVLAFDETELQRFRAELEAPQPKAPPEEPTQEPPGSDNTTLARLDEGQRIDNAALVRVVHALALLGSDKGRQVVAVPVEAKLLLTLAEAQALTGLSRATLRAAIGEGKLKAQQIGRGWKVKRSDLDSYIAKL